MRRTDICLYLGPADRAELEALRTDRNTARKLAWRAGIEDLCITILDSFNLRELVSM